MFLTDFNLFLHVDFLTVLVVEFVLKKRQLLAWNDLHAETILDLPLSAKAEPTLVQVGCNVWMYMKCETLNA